MFKSFINKLSYKKSSIQSRLFFVFGSLALLICISYTLIAILIAYVTEDAVLNRILTNEAKAISAHYQQTGKLIAPNSSYLQLIHSYDNLPASVRETYQITQLKEEIFSPDGKHYHIKIINLHNQQPIFLLAEVSQILVVTKLIIHLADFMLTIALCIVLLSLLIAYFLAKRLAQPITLLADEITQRKNQAPLQLSASTRQDEIGFLAKNLEHAFKETNEALSRESHFTRDISHELRTPITIMNNLMATSKNQPLTYENQQLLQQSILEIKHTVDVLLALARAENIQQETFNLTASIEQCLLQLHQLEPNNTNTMQIDLPEKFMVLGNQHLASLLLHNVLSNAIFHGGKDVHIYLSLTNNVLLIENTIGNQSSAFQQSGLFHGTNLIQRIAQVLQWSVQSRHDGNLYQVHITPLTQQANT